MSNSRLAHRRSMLGLYPADPCSGEVVLGRPFVRNRVERFGCRATESFESLHIRIRSKFCQNAGKFSEFLRNSANLRNLNIFHNIRRKSEKNSSESVQNSTKLWKNSDFFRHSNKDSKKFDESFSKFRIWSGAKACKSCRARKMLKKERVFGCKNRLRYRRERAL